MVNAAELSHIPGSLGLPWIGHTLSVMRDPVGTARKRCAQYGQVYKSRTLFSTSVALLGPEAAQLVLVDQASAFSSGQGWAPNLGQLFPNALLLKEGDEHRLHRHIMMEAFRPAAMARYLHVVDRHVYPGLEHWLLHRHLDIYPGIKRLLLRLSVDMFLGADARAHAPWVGQALAQMMAASVALWRWPWPGSVLHRGLQARRRLVALLDSLVMQAAAQDQAGGDLLHHLCAARDATGIALSRSQIVDHLLFILMASHDTTASAATSTLLALAQHPSWQARVRAEVRDVILPMDVPACRLEAQAHGEALTARLAQCAQLDAVCKESVRLYPPVSAIPRVTLRNIVIDGVSLPAHQHVWLLPIYNHRDARWWSQPDEFRPERFLGLQREDRQHKFLYLPYGAGAHACLGMHLGAAMVKLLVARCVLAGEISAPAQVRRRIYPFPMPIGPCELALRP